MKTEKYSLLIILLLLLATTTGCSTRQEAFTDSLANRDGMTANERFVHDYGSAALNRMQEDEVLRGSLMGTVKSALGTPYVRGGTSTNGFDCSGFVQWAYQKVGVTLPRTAREQSAVGRSIKKQEDMSAGDIVAFRHPRRGYHTGIYVGDGKFIHSPRARKAVQISSIDDPYFKNSFLGARRVKSLSREDRKMAERLVAMHDAGELKPVSVTSSKKKSSSSKKEKFSTSRKASSQTAAISKKTKTSASKKDKTKASQKSSAKETKTVAASSKKSSSKVSGRQSEKSSASNSKSSGNKRTEKKRNSSEKKRN